MACFCVICRSFVKLQLKPLGSYQLCKFGITKVCNAIISVLTGYSWGLAFFVVAVICEKFRFLG